jgi:serine/threonine protein kinase
MIVREPNTEPIPGYRIIEPLGSGGYGEVWKCEAPGGLFKAIKFVYGNLNSLDVDGARAEQELKALNRVKEVRHPFVLSMDRIEVVDGELVIVMELADRNLHNVYEECVQAGLVGIPRDVLLRYIRDAAEALDHMNEKHNLQHLDIKPRNLFLVSDRVKVADFGLVKTLERSGMSGVLGGVTPMYAPPETFSDNISGRSDQYSLAIVYQEMLTGQRPFNGRNARALAHQHLNEEPELRVLPEAERPIVARALSKDPSRRFPNCLAFVRALYQARTSNRPESITADGKRPKTMIDTMEDVLLEQMPDVDELVPVELGPEARRALEEVSQLGMTVHQPQTGALRPTLVLGVGSFGRRALLELRCRFLDRFGDLDKIPLVRFVYVDTDSEAVKAATRGAPEVAFRPGEVYHLPLQPVSHYRRRQLDQISEWLPREKLYAMPRSLQTQSVRALGRLAFTDNYLRLMARLRREVQHASHPDAIYQTVSQTGLALRDNVPRVYVIASAAGGGSGYLTDLGYALRRMLKQLHHADAPLVALIFCGAPDDPATPRAEQANVYATLTELNHFADPAVPFSAQYGTDGPRLVDEGAAFDQTYLLTFENRSPESRRDAMAHLGSYLFHELTTPLGLRLEHARRKHPSEGLPFRSLGTFAVWFPRGLLLRLAARGACQRLLEEWQAQGEATARAELDAACSRALADPELVPDALTARLTELAAGLMEGSPREALTRLLSQVEEQSQQLVALDDPGAWAKQALARVKDWLGSGVQIQNASTVQHRKSRLTKALEGAAAKLAEEWDNRLMEAAAGLMEHPGRRVAVAEEAVARFAQFCQDTLAAHEAQLLKQAPRSRHTESQLQQALEACLGGAGGFSWFGTRSRRQLRVFIDHLAAYARQCLAEDVSTSLHLCYALLRSRLEERLRDLTFCRQRLRHMHEALDAATCSLDHLGDGPVAEFSPSPTPLVSTETFWEAIRESATTRVVLPEGEANLEQAANHFVATLTTEQWLQLDQAFHDQVLAERGGLHKACLATNDLVRHLLVPLLNQAVSTLSDHLPVTDVAQVECGLRRSAHGDLPTRIRTYHGNAVPLLRIAEAVGPSSGKSRVVEAQGGTRADHPAFLLIPASEAGKRFGEEAKRALPELHLVNVPGQADLMFCREQSGLRAEEMERILHTCRSAYDEVAHAPAISPHARFDVQDWTPLDP